MSQSKAKYSENLDMHVEVELSIPLHGFIRTIADDYKLSISEVCYEMLNFAQYDEFWLEQYKKVRPCNSLYGSSKKKGVADELNLSSKQAEDFHKLLAIAKLIGIDVKGIASSLS